MSTPSDLTVRVELNKFKPRWYQADFMREFFFSGKTRFIGVFPRRSGKDIMALNIAIRACLMETMTCYYVWPQFSQARASLWDGINMDGMPILDYIPKEIAKFYSQEMKIKFHNSSIIRFIGSKDIEKLRGGNPKLVILTEYAWQSPKVFDVLRPVLAANRGKAIFISTPWGENHFHSLIEMSKNWPDWSTTHLTVDDTQHMTQEALMLEKQQMDDQFFLQEYYCSFKTGVSGSWYGKQVPAMYTEDRIGQYGYDTYRPVNIAYDLGVADHTALIFFQVLPNNGAVHIIDSYMNKDFGIDHYIQYIEEKGYRLGKHILPHDVKKRSDIDGTCMRLNTLIDAGFDVEILPPSNILDGIETARNLLSRVCVDQKKGADFIKCLTSYRKHWDEDRQVYRSQPVHNWASHMADAFRYMAVWLETQQSHTTAAEIERRYLEAAYGANQVGPKELRAADQSDIDYFTQG